MLRNGFITFGVFNRTSNNSDPALELWSKLMRALPGSSIIVKNGSMNDPLLCDGLIARFVAHGIAEDRLRCIGTTSRPDHLAMFADIDISLDPFPQNGGTRSRWGCPLSPSSAKAPGHGAVGRSSRPLVSTIGSPMMTRDILAIALKYASHPEELAALRGSLPGRVANSAAGNCEIYTRRVEEGYRKFWRDYCAWAVRG
jgi:predicted O-linked N-acetylglucosamine transferase (SPINDLY family)